ncbi:MAG: hypothetical protein KKF68_02825 [Nanoarchaeota archaeon]|nr:hypothetical protein [Nanoarchaeota archaeon]
MIRKYYKNILFFLILILFLATLSFFLYFLGPEEIVNNLGIRNSYLLAFVVSFFGGFSTWSSISFIATLITLSAGGINPIYLGFVAGIALAIGDLVILYIGSKGRELVVGKWEKKLNKFSKKIKTNWVGKIAPLITYLYMGFTPLPNDFILVFLAFIEYPKKKLYLPIILGDLTFTLLVSILASKGFSFFVS